MVVATIGLVLGRTANLDGVNGNGYVDVIANSVLMAGFVLLAMTATELLLDALREHDHELEELAERAQSAEDVVRSDEERLHEVRGSVAGISSASRILLGPERRAEPRSPAPAHRAARRRARPARAPADQQGRRSRGGRARPGDRAAGDGVPLSRPVGRVAPVRCLRVDPQARPHRGAAGAAEQHRAARARQHRDPLGRAAGRPHPAAGAGRRARHPASAARPDLRPRRPAARVRRARASASTSPARSSPRTAAGSTSTRDHERRHGAAFVLQLPAREPA